MARNSFKSFNKVFSLADSVTSSITLTDTTGSAILCNYIIVESRSVDNNDLGYFHLFPQGVYTNNVSVTSTSSTGTAAGAGGVVGVADGSVEYSVHNHLGVSAVNLTNYLGGTGTFVIRYGVLGTANEQKDTLLHRYNTGREN